MRARDKGGGCYLLHSVSREVVEIPQYLVTCDSLQVRAIGFIPVCVHTRTQHTNTHTHTHTHTHRGGTTYLDLLQSDCLSVCLPVCLSVFPARSVVCKNIPNVI